MIAKLRLLAALLVVSVLATPIAAAEPDGDSLVQLANPLQGTDSVFEFSHGNLYPAIALPFPLHAWAPYTQPVPDSFYYQYRQNTFRGIRQTHQPSPWIADYGAFAVMPVTGELKWSDRERGCEFQHADEVARPSYYRVALKPYDVTFEVTPTHRAAAFRVKYGAKAPAYLVIDAFPRGSSVKIIASERKIIGVARNNSGGVPRGFGNYFVMIFDQPFKSFGTCDKEGTHAGQAAAEGEHVGAYVEFDAQATPTVTFRTSSSFIDHAQAETTLGREIGEKSFDDVLAEADRVWNEALGQVRVEGSNLRRRRTFYSTLYRTMLFPHALAEIDAQGKSRYRSPYDGKIYEGVMYTDSGLWDTFRAVHPLMNLLHPKTNAGMIRGLLAAYQQSGWLPAWASPGHRGCMIGNHAFSLVADAWVKGNRDFDAALALEAMKHDSGNEGPIASIGREGVKFYRELGFLPSPDIREATAKTMEFAYNDYCASLIADELGDAAAADAFRKSAENWRNVFDPQTGFVRGKQANGKWVEPFHPDEWGGPFTEGCSWHWTWCVFHNIDGLMEAMGGREAFARKLDTVFEVPPTVRTGSYGGLIHEMTEMIAINLGQYAHGNQPIQHMIYLYVHAGQPWKAQFRARQVMDRLYNPGPKGFCGDEDNGQTSAWYVFSALGFYPVTPGHPTYILGSPLFERATIALPNGKEFVVEAANNAPDRPYIQSATLNGEPLDRAWLMHDEIAAGGVLHLEMGPKPNKSWATGEAGRVPQF